MNVLTRCRLVLGITALSMLSGACVAAEPSGAEIRMHKGRPMVFVDGKPEPLPGYNPISWVRTWHEKQAPRFYPHRMGVYLLSLPKMHTDLGGSQFWAGDDVSNKPLFTEPEVKMQGFTSLDQPAEQIIKGDPGAKFIIRLGPREPRSWRKLHPQEYFITDEGSTASAPSWASDLYWDTASRTATAIVQYCERRPWADRIIGYANFHRDEGTHPALIENWLYDHNPLMIQRWRAFLEKKYKKIDKLNEAHRRTYKSFKTVEMPRDKLRGRTPEVAGHLYWQHAKDNQVLRDYLMLQKELFHLRFRQTAAAMRAGTDRKRIFIHDSLKQTMLGWNCGDFFTYTWSRQLANPEMMAGSGSIGVSELFDAPGFDGIITPHDYQARGVGGVYEPEGIVDSIVLRGKVFFCEMDTRTYTYSKGYWRGAPPPRYGNTLDQREFDAVMWRNLATGLTRGFYNYWMDLYQDWFASEEIHKTIGRQVEVIKESVDWEHETVPGIAMILDDTSVLETNGSSQYLHDAVFWAEKMGIARCGVPHRIYLFEDLALENFPEHRVFYFPNLFKVNDARLKILKEKVFRDGHVVVWGPGSGISDGTTIDAKHAERLTGFKFHTMIESYTRRPQPGKPAEKKFTPRIHMMNVNFPRRTIVSNFTHPFTRDLKADTIIGMPTSYGPVLFPTDGVRLGWAWTQLGQTEVGLAAKDFGKGAGPKGSRGAGDYTALFTTSVPLPADLWRGLARHAGAHVYCETNDILLADKTIVALHSLKTGPKRIALPGTYDVIDVITGKPFTKKTSEIRFNLTGPETRVFRLDQITATGKK